MSGNNGESLRPAKATEEQKRTLRKFADATWPKGLHRYCLFSAEEGNSRKLFRACAWDPEQELLWVQEVRETPPQSSSLPKIWSHSEYARRQFSIKLETDTIRPSSEQLSESALEGIDHRFALVESVLFLDTKGDGKREHYQFNDAIVVDPIARTEALNRVCKIAGKAAGYRTYLLKLISRFFWFGGGRTALWALRERQGAPGKSRVSQNKAKPGQLSYLEILEEGEAIPGTDGSVTFRRQRPASPKDIKNFEAFLTDWWAKQRSTKRKAYDRLIEEKYWHRAVLDRPTYGMFCHHANGIIHRLDLKRKRNGQNITEQYNDARTGQSTDITLGVIEILDVDGFVAKLKVRARVKKKLRSIRVTVIFAVARNSGAVLGYEISRKRESAQAYLRCMARALLSQQWWAKQLGLPEQEGLVHGNIDGILADNGPAAAKKVATAFNDRMGLSRDLVAPERGDLKPTGESLNEIMVLKMVSDKIGYSRGRDPISQEEAKRVLKNPVDIEVFERYVIEAVSEHNLTADRSHLRTREMRDAGVGITPKEIFLYQQSLRRGDAARPLEVAEVYDRLFPWIPKMCRSGCVELDKARYTSDELKAAFNEHAKAPGKVKSLPIKIKRPLGWQDRLYWQTSDGRVEVLEMVDEDVRNHGGATYMEMVLHGMDDYCQKGELQQPKKKGGGQITASQQKIIEAAENRRGNPHAAAVRPDADEQALQEGHGAHEAKGYGVNMYARAPTPTPEGDDNFLALGDELEREFYEELHRSRER